MSKGNIIKDLPSLQAGLEQVRAAHSIYKSFPQAQVDNIFKAAAIAANRARLPLAKMARDETGMGIVEDKVIKNHFAAEYTYNTYKHTKTCGVIEEDKTYGIKKIAEPLGVIAAIVPATNPTSTAIFKILLALKTRNGIILCPHPRAKKCTAEAAKILLDAAVKAGAPENIILCIDEPSIALTDSCMKESDFILATGGSGMVKAAYSSGKPAIGVGAGNVPAIIDDSADIKAAVSAVTLSKTFDNGVICASEQSVIVLDSIYGEVKQEFVDKGSYILSEAEAEKVRKAIFTNGGLNTKIVGQSANTIAHMAGLDVPEDTKMLIGEVERVDDAEPFAHEKLSPVLAMYRAATFDGALDIAEALIEAGGLGHTASIHINASAAADRLQQFEHRMKAGRILVNSPSSHGAIGDLYNFMLAPSLTLGCGSWGGNSTAENVGARHLLNIKTVAEKRENMLWFRTPEQVYYKRGCLPIALEDIADKKRAFIVTDKFLYENGHVNALQNKLTQMGIQHTMFTDVAPDPTLESARKGAAEMRAFKPDCIIAFGGGSPMDAAKIMWLLYEHPDADFADMAMRFADIRKRVYTFPKMGEKAYFVAIPTTAGTGSEVTPFAVITDEATGTKYPIADYELLPNMAIIDANLMMHMPQGLTAASGIDVLVHALEAYVSMVASPYTDGLALEALKLVFAYLKRAYTNGANDPEAREKMADASAMAGMAFANAFLGVCHSMAHKLGAAYDLPHGVSNALMIEQVIRFNASDAPVKMGTFPQYTHPQASDRYAHIADVLGLGGKDKNEKVENLIKEIRSLKAHLGIHASIQNYGVDKDEFMAKLDELSEQAFDDQCTGANPRYPLISEIRTMYLDAFDGK